uniref:Uncharacterized protein n=1 Tax=Caenorhabditis japonica TaxID=281687 RepID=A0A8R1IH42_CAEJA
MLRYLLMPLLCLGTAKSGGRGVPIFLPSAFLDRGAILQFWNADTTGITIHVKMLPYVIDHKESIGDIRFAEKSSVPPEIEQKNEAKVRKSKF